MCGDEVSACFISLGMEYDLGEWDILVITCLCMLRVLVLVVGLTDEQ